MGPARALVGRAARQDADRRAASSRLPVKPLHCARKDGERLGGSSGPRAPRGGVKGSFRRRPISAHSQLEGRQLWRIGDWGGASDQIGRRWETLGARALSGLLGTPRPGPKGAPYVPRQAVVLVEEPELAAQVHA